MIIVVVVVGHRDPVSNRKKQEDVELLNMNGEMVGEIMESIELGLVDDPTSMFRHHPSIQHHHNIFTTMTFLNIGPTFPTTQLITTN